MLYLLRRKAANVLRVEIVRKPITIRMHIDPPLDTLKGLTILLEKNKVIIDHLQVDRYSSGVAMLIIRCQIEKEKIVSVIQQLQGLPGLYELETIEQ